MTYRVHRFDIKMTEDQLDLERFLNGLTGELVTIIPNARQRVAKLFGLTHTCQ